MIKELVGAKGGGSSAPSPVRTPDTLRSLDTVEVVLGIGEGPIEGLENGNQSFFVGDTAAFNADGTPNFDSLRLNFYPGDDVPNYIITPALGGFSRSNTVGVELASGVGVTRETQSGDLDFIDIRLVINQLYNQTDSGIFTAPISFKIEYKPRDSTNWAVYQNAAAVVASTRSNAVDSATPRADQGFIGAGAFLKTMASASSAWDAAVTQNPSTGVITINGKTTSTYVKEFRLPVVPIDGPYDIRVTKTSGDSTTTYFASISWESYQEITKSDYGSFPNTAIMQILARASNQLNSLPNLTGIYKLKRIKVPSNYDPIAKTYAGVWDGTFKIAWSDNPAWCLYDFVTNNVYGMSAYFPVILDKWTTYEAGQWCDTRLADGSVRYTYNDYIQEARPVKDMARYTAGVFNAAFFDDDNGTAFLKVDKDDAASHIFVKENTVDGFHYSFTDTTTRYNDITVTFINPDLNWNEDRRRVFDQDDINKNGRVPLDFVAVGCIYEKEALRRAKYKLITSLTETMMINFKTNRLGQFVQPWDVILISDPSLGFALSGRMKTVAGDSLSCTLRDPVFLEAGVTYTAKFKDAQGNIQSRDLINADSGSNMNLMFSTPLPSDIPAYCVFTIEDTVGRVGAPKPFRVLKVLESEGDPDNYEITAIEINRNKWNDADNFTDSAPIVYSALPDPNVIPGPTSVNFKEQFIQSTKEFHLIVDPVFNRDTYHFYNGEYEVWSRPVNDGAFIKRTLQHGDTIVNHPPGNYEFKILPFNLLGRKADLNSVGTYTFNVSNPAEAPLDVPWIRQNNDELVWIYDDPPLDFAGFEIRYTFGDNPRWEEGVNIHPGGLISASPYPMTQFPPKLSTAMIKAVDFFGNYSATAATVLINQGDDVTINIIESFDRKAQGWPGTITGGNVDVDGTLVATDPGTKFYSGNPAHQMYPSPITQDMYKAAYGGMSYETTFTADAPAFFSIDFNIEGTTYLVQYRKSGDTGWLPLTLRQRVDAGSYDTLVTITGGHIKPLIDKFTINLDVDDIVEEFGETIIAAAGTRLPITKTYTNIKLVHITLETDGGTGYIARVEDKDHVLGPLIKVYDNNFTPTTGKLSGATVKGY